jgi:diguanylate cyclase (GGDEF)-like protein
MPEELRRDGLTGFYVREELVLFLARLMAGAKEDEKGFSIALIDLDHFKKFNDKHGHLFGDEILKYATSTLRLTFYESQCSFFRYGGDEFIAVFPGRDPKGVFAFIRQCQYNLFRRPCLFENKFYRVTISCGIAGFPSHAKTPEELIQKADEAMYFSKRNGRNMITLIDKIPYLKFRKTFMQVAGLLFLVAAILILYRLSFNKIIKPTIGQIEKLKIVTKPENLDTIILKNGVVFEGQILSETDGKVLFNLYVDRGEGRTVFDKREIAQIKRAPKASPQK